MSAFRGLGKARGMGCTGGEVVGALGRVLEVVRSFGDRETVEERVAALVTWEAGGAKEGELIGNSRETTEHRPARNSKADHNSEARKEVVKWH